MRAKVVIVCPDCQARTEVHIYGGWDIADVRHECDPGGGSRTGWETFTITFDPPRRAF